MAPSLSVLSVKWVRLPPISENPPPSSRRVWALCPRRPVSANGWPQGGVPASFRPPSQLPAAPGRCPATFHQRGPGWRPAGAQRGALSSPPHAATLSPAAAASALGPTVSSSQEEGTHQGGSVRQGCPCPTGVSKAGPGVRSPDPRQSWTVSEEEVGGPSPGVGGSHLGRGGGTEAARL